MAITVAQVIQYDDANVVADHTKSSISTSAGNRLVIAVLGKLAGGGAITSITDSGSNTWSKIVEASGTTFETAAIWSTTNNAAAITSYVLHGDNSATVQSTLYEVVGTDVGNDVTHTGNGSSTSISSGSSGTAANANCIAIGVGGHGLIFADATFTSSAFTTAGGTFQARTARSGFIQCTAGYVILSAGSTTAQTFSATSSANSEWASAIALFLPVGVAVVTPTQFNNYMFLDPGDGMTTSEKIK